MSLKHYKIQSADANRKTNQIMYYLPTINLMVFVKTPFSASARDTAVEQEDRFDFRHRKKEIETNDKCPCVFRQHTPMPLTDELFCLRERRTAMQSNLLG